jgi:NADH pyrophosphatase NudC (nudix superfamily)
MIHMHLAILLISTLAAGWLMAQAGVSKSVLEWRRRRRICPSCGKQIQARVCSGCGSV